jgi:hypothetical protein
MTNKSTKLAPITICMQAQPNEAGIEYAHIVLTKETSAQLRTLFKLNVKHNLSSVNTENLPVQWLKNGAVIETRFACHSITPNGITFTASVSALPNPQGLESDNYFLITAVWLLGGIEELNATYHRENFCNEFGQVVYEDVGQTLQEQTANIEKLNMILERDRIA